MALYVTFNTNLSSDSMSWGGKTVSSSAFAGYYTTEISGSFTIESALQHGWAAAGTHPGTCPSGSPTRSGYTFSGWSVTFNGITDATTTNRNTTICVNPNTLSGSCVISFIWKASGGGTPTTQYCSVSFNANGGSLPYGMSSSSSQPYGYYSIPSGTPTRSGYTFKYWQDSAGGTCNPGSQVYLSSSSRSFTAVWEQNVQSTNMTITYYANGGSWSNGQTTRSYTYQMGSNQYTEPAPTRSGYTFLGWRNSVTNGLNQAGVLIMMVQPTMTMTAEWQQNAEQQKFTVSYNTNGGSLAAGMVSSVSTTGGIYYIQKGSPTKSGYSFLGWKYSYNNEIVQPGANIFISGNCTLTAQWQSTAQQTFKVTYSANGGTFPSGFVSSENVRGGNYPVKSGEPTRSGYTFTGWKYSLNNKIVQAGDMLFISGNCTLTAQWTENAVATSSIYYNLNGGTGSIVTDTGKVGSTTKISSTVPTKSGYTFSGWSTTQNGTVKYLGGETYTYGSTSITLYAVWTVVKQTGYVYYNANGGSGAPSSQSGTVGGTITISRTEPTRSGYAFLGWATTSSASSPQYSPGSTFPINSTSTTLYAVWQQNAPSVTYYTLTLSGNNKGTVNPSSYYRPAGTTITLPSATPTNGNYTFLGWSTSSAATSATYLAGSNYTINATRTLYAVYRNDTPASKYNLSYNANGGTLAAGTSTKSYAQGENVTLAAAPSRTNYTFQGWKSSADSRTYGAGAGYTMPAQSVTMTAQWQANAPTKKTLGAPEWSMSQTTFEINTTAKLQWQAVTGATGYNVFEGNSLLQYVTTTYHNVSSTTTGSRTYYVQAVSTRDDYTSPSAKSVPKTITFAAPAEEIKKYTIKYDANGGTGAPVSEQFAAGTIQLSSIQPTRSGYDFLGWSTSAFATTPSYKPGQDYGLYRDTQLFAVWKEHIEYATITFEPNGGNVVPVSKTFIKDLTFGDARNSSPGLPTPTRSPVNEYDFAGWYTSPTASGTKKTSSSVCTGEQTLYAHWNRNAPAAPVWYTTSVTVARNHSVPLTWHSVTSAVGYRVRINGGTPISVGSENTYNYLAGANFTGCYVEVSAVNSDGQWGPWSAKLNVELDRGSAPPAPAECYINRYVIPPTIFTNDPRNTEFDVSWTRVIDIDNDLVGYKVYYAIDGSNNWKLLGTFSSTETSAKFKNSILTGATSVQCRVFAYDDVGNEGQATLSNSVTVSKKSPPSTPTKLTVPDQSRLPVTERDGKIKATIGFGISWGSSTDVDGDLVGYKIQEKRDDEAWGNEITVSAAEANYTEAVVPRGIHQVEYRIQAFDALNLTSDWAYSGAKEVINNVPPTTPKAFDPPKQIKGGQSFKLSWTPSTDEDGNLAGYIIQRSLDGEKWETIADVDSEFVYETIPKEGGKHHDTVAYRVKAYDTLGAESGWCTSRTYNVSNNAAPVVTSDWPSGEYIGQYENGFSFMVHVTDEELDAVDIEIALIPVGATEDAKIVLSKMTDVGTIGGFSTVYTIDDSIFSSLPMQRYRLIITAKDAEGEGECELEFVRKGTSAFLTLKEPMAYPEFIQEVQFLDIAGSWQSDAIIKVEVTNNANDRAAAVRWEDCTAEALAHDVYWFKNKMTYTPAFNFRITLKRGPSGAGGYISHVAGCFETVGGIQQSF